eukprot:scaffold2624_cov154-Cylindrotheca_fusiformis.AAC.2
MTRAHILLDFFSNTNTHPAPTTISLSTSFHQTFEEADENSYMCLTEGKHFFKAFLVWMLIQVSPRYTSSVLLQQGLRRPRFLRSVAMNSGDDSTTPQNLVVVIAGPTAVGKSDIAAKICARDQGVIISADSVQAYRGVNIGANKPNIQEQKETPHVLIDIMDCSQIYNAADWRADAIVAIQNLVDPKSDIVGFSPRKDDVLKAARSGRMEKGYAGHKKLLPVVCGGTMMYLQWLVHGAPDAVRPGKAEVELAQTKIAEYRNKNDFQGAMDYVASYGKVFGNRVARFCGEDWYRLRRTLEVALAVDGAHDKQEMHEKIYTGERSCGLQALGYDVRCFFLCPDDRMGHTKVIDERCEKMLLNGLLQETTDLSLSGQMPEMASRAIGYRQSLEYLQNREHIDNEIERFDNFIDLFAAATRRYAKKQMSWFRKEKDFFFIPVSLSRDKSETADMIRKFCHMRREDFETELYSFDGISAKCRRENELQGKKMKFYQPARYILKPGTEEFDRCLLGAVECRKQMLQYKKPRIDGNN